MKPRDYCCCAIPMVNVGIYATLTEQLALGILVGALAVGTPSIVGASTPSFASWVLGIISFVGAGVQLLGFIGVAREKTILFRRYVTLHGLVLSAAFSVAAAWIIMSAARHPSAKAKCIQDFFTADDGTSASEGDALCTIFPWVDVGIMGALWVILAAFHFYLFLVLSSYGTAQRRDHDQYDRVYDPSQPLTTENIPLDRQNDPWDSRPSEDFTDGRNNREYKHLRQESAASASDVLNQPYQEPKDGSLWSKESYSAHTDQYKPEIPSYAYTQDPAVTPTSTYHSYGVSRTQSRVEQPPQAQPHPAEGSFRRKTPRYVGGSFGQ